MAAASPSPSYLPPPATSGPIQLKSIPVGPQTPPLGSVPISAGSRFDGTGSVATLPNVFLKQWSLGREIPPESLISQEYLRTAELTAREMTLKEAIYIALRNNPQVKAVELNPVSAMESVRQSNGVFDPLLSSQIDVNKSSVPTSSILQTGGGAAFTQKFYDWNFGITKVLSTTNGTVGLIFDNERALSNSFFASINPTYTPTIAMSLSQPLLQNFGWKFATINVRIAESGQKQAQWQYEQSLMDFVQRVAADYWNVVLAEENLAVTRAALKFNQDLVRQNRISVKVGTLAPLDLQEAQSAAATAEANVFTAEANLKTARSQLRQDIMYNPQGTFLPADIEPANRPNPTEVINTNEEHALELAVEYLPSLAAMREAIRGALLQVKYQENQTLPQLNLGAQFGVTATAGSTICQPLFFKISGVTSNCVAPGPAPGIELPFGGQYSTALNRMWNFSFYNYAAVLSFQMPLDNASAKAALAQARVLYAQQRMQYRSALSQAVVGVQNAIANVIADQRRVQATEEANFYAKQALHDEEVRFRVGMATTHDLLQFQQQQVAAEGNQVQAAIDLENAKLNLKHAEGTLLQAFDIEFQLQNPHETPWYTRF
jgi:outer membrane protein TolC